MAQQSPDRFRGRNLRLFGLMLTAWHLNREQLIGGPKWIEPASWDIDAHLLQEASLAQLPEMMEAMFADRFHLAPHREVRGLPVYSLPVIKSGIKLHAANGAGDMSASPRLIRYASAIMNELAG